MYALKLYSLDGTQTRLVAEVTVPAFITFPQVIIWGSRAFCWSVELEKYLETFAYVVMQH